MKVVRVIMAAAGLAVCASMAFADQPKKMEGNWLVKDSTMEVTVFHKVQDPDKHFIEKIEIMQGGKVVASKSYTKQTDKEKQVERFVLHLKSNEVMTIKATSNVGGESKSIKYAID